MRLNGTGKSAGSNLRRAALALVLGTLMLSAGSCRQEADQLGIRFKMEVKNLRNGLKVVLIEDHTVPLVSYQTWFRVGSVDERPGITGISHLFEHLMFKGTPKYGPKQFFEQLEARGAEVNAFTTRDYTVYHETIAPDLLDKVIEMESDRLVNLQLDEAVLASERMVVFEERRLRTENSPGGRIQEALWRLAYRHHPYGWPVIGYPEDLASIKLPQLIDYFRTHYQPANATVVVVGDIDTRATLERIRLAYEPIASRPRPKREVRPEPEQKEERRQVIHDGVAAEQFAIGYHISAAANPDTYALDVLSNILFAGTNSRAYRLLVEEKDVALSVGGTSFTPTFPGLFLISGMMKKGIPAARAEELLDQVIREVQDKPVAKEEIDVAVKQLTVQLVDGVRTQHGLGILIGTVDMILGDPRRYAEDLSKYLKVAPSDVQKVAQKYLVPNNRSVVTLAPKAVAAAEGAR